MDTLLTQPHAELFVLAMQWSQLLEPWSARWWDETVCSMLVGLACGVLGTFVVLRRMALIGDALSHAVLPGVVVAFMLTHDTGALGLLIGALIAGLLTAVLINVVSRFSRTKEDSAIGIVFTALFAVGIILISVLPAGTHFDLSCFLFGDPLAIVRSDLLLMSIICPLVLLTVAVMYHRFKLVSFDPLVAAAMGVPVVLLHYLLMGMLSATIVAGLKTTGVILVIAMVVTPASAAYQLTNRFSVMIVLSGLFGSLATGAGMSLAFMLDTPTGPMMVLVAVAIFSVCVLFSPSHGWVFDQLRRRKLASHVANEDVLKAVYRLNDVPVQDAPAMLLDKVNLTRDAIGRAIDRLIAESLLQRGNGTLSLTEQGRAHAETLVRAHRLWETYLADEGMPPDLVHDEAERLEHAHDLAEQLDEKLGRPLRDPHGQEIPRTPAS
jgi:ABC-type Mn2+/Zn2+ transport system permease subunit/Mn-dependent DtxR family transcriptional regulator